jgi:hypothetical protein
MLEIKTLEEFRYYKNKGNGYIAIIDYHLPKNFVHRTKCSFVQERYFIQKVIKNQCKNGKYFYTDDYRNALNYSEKMELCQNCFA